MTGPRLSILIYHRVLAEPDPLRPWEICAQQFRQHLSWVSNIFNVLPLKEATHALKNQNLPRRTLCITFDDGYRDNLEVALPILKEFRMPATFFCTTAFTEGEMMWNDQVIEALRFWPSDAIDIPELKLFNLSLHTPFDRSKSAETILTKLKYVEKKQREQMAKQLLVRVKTSPQRQMMTAEEIRLLHQEGMEIGGHTHSHPILANLEKDEALEEIQLNKKILEDITGETITSFAYPNGKPGKDYLAEHCDMVAQAGYQLAVSTSAGVAKTQCDPFQLPRFTPWDKSRRRFLARLALNHK